MSIQETSLQYQFQSSISVLKHISSGISSGNSSNSSSNSGSDGGIGMYKDKALNDWIGLYIPMVRFMFINYEKYLHVSCVYWVCVCMGCVCVCV